LAVNRDGTDVVALFRKYLMETAKPNTSGVSAVGSKSGPRGSEMRLPLFPREPTSSARAASRKGAKTELADCVRPRGDQITLPRLPLSGFILGSPGRVSGKREFSWIRLETFGNSRPKKFERRSPETIGDEKSPHLAGLSHPKKEIL
jgi:hypothetical protein